jgi:hypothetical protein
MLLIYFQMDLARAKLKEMSIGMHEDLSSIIPPQQKIDQMMDTRYRYCNLFCW